MWYKNLFSIYKIVFVAASKLLISIIAWLEISPVPDREKKSGQENRNILPPASKSEQNVVLGTGQFPIPSDVPMGDGIKARACINAKLTNYLSP